MTALLESKNLSASNVEALSEEETKLYLTPFAFKIDKSLFGLPLASPSKRGIALIIDLTLIALLSDISGVFLAFAIAVTLYFLGNNKRAQERGKKKGHKRRAIMRFIAAFILFVLLLDTLPPLMKFISGDQHSELNVDNDEGQSASFTQAITIGALTLSTIKTISESDCQDVDCWQSQLGSVAKKVATISYKSDIKITEEQLIGIFDEIGNEIDLPLAEQNLLVSSMHDKYQKELSSLKVKDRVKVSERSIEEIAEIDLDDIATIEQKNESTLVLEDDGELIDNNNHKNEESKKPVYSIIKWFKGIIEDLGLEFGWATFYFTAFTALWGGQTIGKKLLGIKVLQLDGTPLSLWDSFGRYGGYGAGIATGLLGFIQIYWNPNKQAIHDQISATVVIDVNKARLHQNEQASDFSD
jgi:uncharacterized RDD family membrane protein YckC